MPWGALSRARWLQSIGNVFRGSGINSRVSGGHGWKYMHIRAIYMHIRNIDTNTIIYMNIRSYTVSQSDCSARGSNIDAYMYIYVHIHAYTCMYGLCSNRTGSLNICTYMRAYMLVFALICVRICTYMQVCAIIRTSMRLATFRTKNTCIYVQYVQIRANTA